MVELLITQEGFLLRKVFRRKKNIRKVKVGGILPRSDFFLWNLKFGFLDELRIQSLFCLKRRTNFIVRVCRNTLLYIRELFS